MEYNSIYLIISKTQNCSDRKWVIVAKGFEWQEVALLKAKHKGIFWGYRTILYPDYGGAYMIFRHAFKVIELYTNF